MKKLVFVLAILAVTLPAFSGTTDITQVAGYYTSGFSGGEFTVSDWNPDPILTQYRNLYSSLTSGILGNDSFQSFCLERNENTASNIDSYTIDDAAILGGGGPNPDPISNATAWLYKNFAKGTLSIYNYSTTTANADFVDRGTSAKALQEAIWYLEQESSSATAGAKIFLNYYLANSGTIIADYAGLISEVNTVSGVAVFNPSKGGAPLEQSQLILVPAPGALILASLGTGFVGWLRRRKA